MANLLQRLKRHPFPVVAWFERVIAVSFAFPEGLLRPLVPKPLIIDTYEGLGFITVALVWTKKLRPAGVPGFLGRDFFLAGYRIFTRMLNDDGRRLRGLKILRSETDSRTMVTFGNLLTHYNYQLVNIEHTKGVDVERLVTRLADGTVTLDISFDESHEPELPPTGSPFPDWHIARRFAGPMPFTFDSEGDGKFVVIEGRRTNWTPRPIKIVECKVRLFNTPPFNSTTPVLANAFYVEKIPYRWEKGRLCKPRVEDSDSEAR